MVFASSDRRFTKTPPIHSKRILFLANHRHGAVFKGLDTALRVFSFVGLGMGGKSWGKEFPVLRQSGDKRTALEEAPRRRNTSRGSYRATELSLLYEGAPSY